MFEDAQRDLGDLRAGIPIFQLGIGYENPEHGDGILFLTYSKLVSRGKNSSRRLEQVKAWLSGGGAAHGARGLLVFDEGHKAKNRGTKSADRVQDLQVNFPDHPVLYATATAATEVAHMAYMDRLGLWGSGTEFADFKDFQAIVSRGELRHKELVAVELRRMGLMSCRSLSWTDTSFEVQTVPLSREDELKYDQCCELWRELSAFVGELESLELLEKKMRRTFWACHQRFFKALLVGFKVPLAVEYARQCSESGEAVVFSMWATHESVMDKAEDQLGDLDAEEAEEFFSGPELMFTQFIDTHLPKESALEGRPELSSTILGFKEQVKALKLPPNPLDFIIDSLGGPHHVAEMSGRSRRQGRDASGQVELQQREDMNVKEQRAFQSGKKGFAVITEAASAGISLHSDARPGVDASRRRMICLELPWAADKAVQQLGRVHRSNQRVPPAFTCLVSSLAGEVRFVSAVTRRLQSLGALTRGDRESTLGGSSAFKFGWMDLIGGPVGVRAFQGLRQALRGAGALPAQIEGEPPVGESWEAFLLLARETGEKYEVFPEKSAGQEKDWKQCLNRLLGVPCKMQQGLFMLIVAFAVEAAQSGKQDFGFVRLSSAVGFPEKEVVEIERQEYKELGLELVHLAKEERRTAEAHVLTGKPGALLQHVRLINELWGDAPLVWSHVATRDEAIVGFLVPGEDLLRTQGRLGAQSHFHRARQPLPGAMPTSSSVGEAAAYPTAASPKAAASPPLAMATSATEATAPDLGAVYGSLQVSGETVTVYKGPRGGLKYVNKNGNISSLTEKQRANVRVLSPS